MASKAVNHALIRAYRDEVDELQRLTQSVTHHRACMESAEEGAERCKQRIAELFEHATEVGTDLNYRP